MKEGTPKLPFSTVFNSLNWVDKTERADDGESPGEIDGTQAYARSNKPVACKGNTYCGTHADFLGNGSYSAPPPLDWTGALKCCTGEGTYDLHQAFNVTDTMYDVLAGAISGPDPYFLPMATASNLPFSFLIQMCPFGAPNGPWQVRLLGAPISYPPDFIGDFQECNFPGYMPQTFWGPSANGNPDGSATYIIQCGPHHFEQAAGLPGTLQTVYGYVVVDSDGYVLWYQMAENYYTMENVGDYIDLSFNMSMPYDYA